MPTYDYECDACGHEFELFQSIKESVKRKCPECSKLKLRRLFGTGAAVVFKGSGFYETDYRSDSYKKGAEKAKKAQEKNLIPRNRTAKAVRSQKKRIALNNCNRCFPARFHLQCRKARRRNRISCPTFRTQLKSLCRQSSFAHNAEKISTQKKLGRCHFAVSAAG